VNSTAANPLSPIPISLAISGPSQISMVRA
jgi:hypothetical protein